MNDFIKNFQKVLDDYQTYKLSIDPFVFDSFYLIKVKKLLFKDEFYVALCSSPYSEDEMKRVISCFENYMNLEHIDCKSLLCIFTSCVNSFVNNYTYYFSAKMHSFVHPLIVSCDTNKRKVYFDKDFDYLGAKSIKKFVLELTYALEKTGDGSVS